MVMSYQPYGPAENEEKKEKYAANLTAPIEESRSLYMSGERGYMGRKKGYR